MKSSICSPGNISHFGFAAILAIAAAGQPLFAQNTDLPVAPTSLSKPDLPQAAFALQLPTDTFVPKQLALAQDVSSISESANLPDAPTPIGFSDPSAPPIVDPTSDTDSHSTTPQNPIPATRYAPAYHRYIQPGEVARKLTTTQQVVFGLGQTISPYFLLQIAAAAGWEQAVNSAPNYGSNFTAYGQRVGAAAARNASQSFFSYSVMAPLLHEDARYYIMGNRRNAFVRATYAASRAFITRDAGDGHDVPNYAEVVGYAMAAGLTNAYYPPVNRTFGRNASSFGVSLGGLAVSNVVREFLPDILRVAHLDRFE